VLLETPMAVSPARTCRVLEPRSCRSDIDIL